MLAALAGVWLLVFVPSWMKTSSSREQQRAAAQMERQERRDLRAKSLNTQTAAVAIKVRRAFIVKRVSGVLSMVAIAATLWVAAVFGSFENPWMPLGISVSSFAVFFATNRLAHSLQIRALNSASQRRRPANFDAAVRRSMQQTVVAPQASEIEVKDPRAWNATGVPSQILRSPVGTLETPEIADVVDFAASLERRENENSQVPVETSSINLDEILRRRRANG
jgi:hypothetical protein